MNPLVVCLFAGPGAGKSTIAASVFAELKWKGIRTELVTEFAKDLVWEDSLTVLKDQTYVYAHQWHRLWRLFDPKHKIQVIVTDSPPVMGIVYTPKKKDPLIHLMASDHWKMNTLNVFIERKKKYVKQGRLQTYADALEKDKEILDMLKFYGYNYFIIEGNKNGVKRIVKNILIKLQKYP